MHSGIDSFSALSESLNSLTNVETPLELLADSLPQGLQCRPITAPADLESFSIENRLLGLPGGLSITASQSKKYFGVKGRENFFDRHHWLQRQRNIIVSNAGENISSLLFSNESFDTSNDSPFAANRNSPKVLLPVLSGGDTFSPYKAKGLDFNDDSATLVSGEELSYKVKQHFLCILLYGAFC
jgi:hypothetical protein